MNAETPIRYSENFENPRFERLRKAHEVVVESLNQELYKQHSDKLYHDPSHTVGDEKRPGTEGVVTVLRYFSSALKSSFSESLQLGDRENEERAALVTKGMYAGMMAHDLVIELDGITGGGMIMRRRGWKEGGNEYESYLNLRRLFLEAYTGEKVTEENQNDLHKDLLLSDDVYSQYITSAEQIIAGTDPDLMNFTFPVDPQILESYSDEVKKALLRNDSTKEAPQYALMSIDSSKTEQSLEALLGSTSDLASAVSPERFLETGNAEFWELNYSACKDCAAFLSSPDTLSRTRALELVAQMRGWRKLQPGVALGQRLRLEKNFTVENISTLFEKTFGITPKVEEVEFFIKQVVHFIPKIDESIELTAKRFSEFCELFDEAISKEGGPTLRESEQEDLRRAIYFMGGEGERLQKYVSHVDQALVKNYSFA